MLRALRRPAQVVLGFKQTKGHRMWRRLRGLLLKAGCIETIEAERRGAEGAAAHTKYKCIRWGG